MDIIILSLVFIVLIGWNIFFTIKYKGWNYQSLFCYGLWFFSLYLLISLHYSAYNELKNAGDGMWAWLGQEILSGIILLINFVVLTINLALSITNMITKKIQANKTKKNV